MDLTVFSWLQDYVDHMQPITRKDIVDAVLKSWEEMPEPVILNAYSHLPRSTRASSSGKAAQPGGGSAAPR